MWSLLLAAGYVRPRHAVRERGKVACDLVVTNREVAATFDQMVDGWFARSEGSYNAFVRALLADDVRGMNDYLEQVAIACMSSFDSGAHPSARSQPERFWHGLVLGLLVDLRGRYEVRSNPESGFGRCGVMLTPLGDADAAYVLEFKVLDRRWDGEEDLLGTVASAHAQIKRRAYATSLVERGIAPERIRTYGIAFRGTEVLAG